MNETPSLEKRDLIDQLQSDDVPSVRALHESICLAVDRQIGDRAEEPREFQKSYDFLLRLITDALVGLRCDEAPVYDQVQLAAWLRSRPKEAT